MSAWRSRLDWPAALLLLALGWAATLWVAPWSDDHVSDLFVYRLFAEPVLHGALPYRDAFLEYPPLAAPVIALPGVAGTGADAFRAAFAGWTFLLAAATVLLCGALAARTQGARRRALLAAALSPLLCGALVRTHFDFAPVALLLAALLLLATQRPRTGMALLGLSVMTKGFPIVVVPVALAWLAAHAGRRTTVQSALALLVAVAVPAATALALSPSGALDAVRFQVDRPVQVESLPATGLLGLDALGAGRAVNVHSYRSDGLLHPAAGVLATAGVGAIGAAVFLLAFFAARRRDARTLVLASLAAVAAFMIFGKVLSPQYVIWLVPLGTLAFAWRLHALAAAVAAVAILTQVEFPSRYSDLVHREPFPVAVVTVRNLVLLVVVALAVRALQLGGEEELIDRHRGAPVALDDDGVEPGVLV